MLPELILGALDHVSPVVCAYAVVVVVDESCRMQRRIAGYSESDGEGEKLIDFIYTLFIEVII